MQHDLKVWPEYFDAILDGRKKFEVRKYDRPFKVGDELHLREYSPGPDEYTGRTATRRITYLVDGNEPTAYAFGVRTGFCVLGIDG